MSCENAQDRDESRLRIKGHWLNQVFLENGGKNGVHGITVYHNYTIILVKSSTC